MPSETEMLNRLHNFCYYSQLYLYTHNWNKIFEKNNSLPKKFCFWRAISNFSCFRKRWENGKFKLTETIRLLKHYLTAPAWELNRLVTKFITYWQFIRQKNVFLYIISFLFMVRYFEISHHFIFSFFTFLTSDDLDTNGI